MLASIVLKDATTEFDKEYLYEIPKPLAGKVNIGSCVIIPFGRSNKEEKGFVISLSDGIETGFYVKPVISVCEPSPMLDENQLELIKKMTVRYSCTYGDAIRLMIPPDTSAGKPRGATVFLVNDQEAQIMAAEGDFGSIGQLRTVEYLLEYGESLQSDVMISCQVTKSAFYSLKKKGIVGFGRKVLSEAPQNIAKICIDSEFELTDEQRRAVSEITRSDISKYNEFLLFGITGSGKTEVYLDVIRHNLDHGFGAILLVPEISLTPQMTERLEQRFGDNVRVLHSRLTATERNRRWQDVLSGKVKIVAGARSAIFAPVKGLKLIIIDEEQESSYKSETHPRYHAYDIAAMRLNKDGGVLVSGSATPRIETFHKALNGEAVLLELSKRTGSSGIPDVKVVDMREELASGNRSIFSHDLRLSMEDSFTAGEKVMLFINRRGHSGFFLCRDCGHVPKCTSCSISLTYHSANKVLICHYCGKIYHLPKTCPICRSPHISGFGAGTQQIEEICRKEFPGKNIIRMDRDTTTARDSHQDILDRFVSEGDILIGTQMIAKGHDFPEVTTVGILAADLSLGMSDFRSSERTFQLITQAAGRSGRGDKLGRVVIQAYNVDDYAVRYAAAQDYRGFYEQEISFRRQSGYPPFGMIGIIIISSKSEQTAFLAAERLRAELISCSDDSCGTDPASESIPDIMEAAKAPVFRIRERYRFRIIIKGIDEKSIAAYFDRVRSFPKKDDVLISYDINPFQMV